MTARETRLLGAVVGGAVTLAAINGVGYLLAGGRPGYTSAQGGAGLFFTAGIMALPVGMVVGILLAGLFARRRKPPAG